MFKNILNTFFTKIFTAVLSFFIVIINSKELGAGSVGEISLIILSVAVYLLIHEFFSGAFVYFVPRADNFQLLIIAYIGVFITLIPFSILYYFVPLAPVQYFYYVIVLSGIFAFSNTHQLILLGNENITDRNLISFVQTLVVFICLIYFFYYERKLSVFSYIYSLYIGYISAFVLGFIKIKKYMNISSLSGIFPLFIKLIRLGSYNALSNLIQKMNYRLSYYFIEYFWGISALGKFSVAVQLSESTWLVGQSVASVQYARIANIKNNSQAIDLTIVLFKILFLMALFAVSFLALLPENFYLLVFGNEFSGLNYIVWLLTPGIVALSCNMILSHYFSGIGMYKINTIASSLGLFFIVVLSILLIPDYGLTGAGISMSVSYIASTVYLIWQFITHTKIRLSNLLIQASDLIILKDLFVQKLSKK